MSVRDIDHGWRRIVKEVRKMDNAHVKVGFPIDKHAKVTSKSMKKVGGPLVMLEIIVIAAVHEFGAPKKNIPERSFMRTAFDENIPEIEAIKSREYDRIITGKSGIYRSLDKIGVWFTAKVKKKIKDIKIPPLKPATVKRKGSSNPLIDSGQMIQSVQHVVAMK